MSTISILKVSTKDQLHLAYEVRFKVFVDEQKVPENQEIDV